MLRWTVLEMDDPHIIFLFNTEDVMMLKTELLVVLYIF